MKAKPRVGRKLRALRKRRGQTQAALARRLGISASYLNLIEHGRRPLSARLLLRVARHFDLDLESFSESPDGELAADLLEVAGDPLFARPPLDESAIADAVANHTELARTAVRLHAAYAAARGSARALAERALDLQEVEGLERTAHSSEQVSDLIQRHENHFPEIEEEAERLRRDGGLGGEDLFGELARALERLHGVQVRILRHDEMAGATRRFLPDRRELRISEVLRRGSRNFQLAHQIGLLRCSPHFDRLAKSEEPTSEESRALGRVALANYFASAVLMPYEEYRRAAEDVRYDLDLLGHRFRVSFEQVCHRLTTLGRPGARGVPFHMVRVDIAGNISKKFSATGIRFPRFSGLCPLWNVHAAFLQPGMIRAQLSRLPDGTTFFSIARTEEKHRGGFHAARALYAIALGTDIGSARRLVYADGVDLENADAAAPVGVTCRLCERMDCTARAFPPIQRPLSIDENVRGTSFYAPADTER